MPQTVIKKFTKSFSVQGIDPDQRIVYGVASSPTPDSQDDIVTTEAMRDALPEFMEFGNLRYMHQDERIDAVGKVLDAHIGKDGKTYITAKVVDDSAWEKVKAGVLCAFSIGGEVLESARKWIKNRFMNVITRLRLTEISLVDNPAHKEAKILLFKFNSTQGGLTHMSKPKQLVAGPKNDGASEDVVSQIKKRATAAKTKTVKKAALPDSDKVINQLLAIQNDMVLNGNSDGADFVMDAIACLQAAVNDQAVDDADPNPDPNADDMAADDTCDMTMADDGVVDPNVVKADGADGDGEDDGDADEDQGDQPPVEKADGVDTNADEDAEGGEGGQDQDFSMDGTNQSDVTDNETDPEDADDNQPESADSVRLSSQAITRKGANLPARVAAIVEARENARLNKALVGEFQKFKTDVVDVFNALLERVERLENRPARPGPVRMQVAENRDVAKGVGVNGGSRGSGVQHQIEELSAKIKSIDSPLEREKLGKELALLQIKQGRVLSN